MYTSPKAMRHNYFTNTLANCGFLSSLHRPTHTFQIDPYFATHESLNKQKSKTCKHMWVNVNVNLK